MTTTTIKPLLEHRDRLLAFVRKRIDDPELAEDLFQELLLKALRAAPDLDNEQRLLAWFYRVLQNAVIDVYRRRTTQPSQIENPEPLLESLAAADPAADPELCACFVDLLPNLKPEYREMIQRLDLDQEQSDRVADQLGIDRNNLKVRRHRARQALRKELEQACRACARHSCLDCTCGK